MGGLGSGLTCPTRMRWGGVPPSTFGSPHPSLGPGRGFWVIQPEARLDSPFASPCWGRATCHRHLGRGSPGDTCRERSSQDPPTPSAASLPFGVSRCTPGPGGQLLGGLGRGLEGSGPLDSSRAGPRVEQVPLCPCGGSLRSLGGRFPGGTGPLVSLGVPLGVPGVLGGTLRGRTEVETVRGRLGPPSPRRALSSPGGLCPPPVP